MRLLAPAALFAAGLLVAASASADTAAPPPVAAPPAAPPAAPVAPAYPAPLSYAPGYPPPYMMYPYAPPGAGAPPPYWMPIAPPTERRSNALRNTGIVLFGVGGAVGVVGSVLFFATITSPCIVFDEASPGEPAGAPAAAQERIRSAHQALNGCDTDPGLGLGIMTAGLVTAVVGIPLFVIGSKQVPARTMTGKLVPELTVGAANGSLRWSF